LQLIENILRLSVQHQESVLMISAVWYRYSDSHPTQSKLMGLQSDQ
jgi:hypothetical protein